jgi:hypothetical protein
MNATIGNAIAAPMPVPKLTLAMKTSPPTQRGGRGGSTPWW